MLQKFGLDDKEAKVYLAILELGQSTITPIAERSGVKRTSIYYFIDHLVELGLVSKLEQEGKTTYTAESPERLLDYEKSRLELVREAIPFLMSSYNQLPGKPRISYFEGTEQVKNIIREETRCEKEALYIWPGREVMEMVGGGKFMIEIDNARINKGVSLKTIRFKSKDLPYETSASGLEYLRELRWAPEEYNHLKTGIGIYDTGKVGIFSSKGESYGIMIESQELYETMKVFHTLLWNQSTEAKPGEG